MKFVVITANRVVNYLRKFCEKDVELYRKNDICLVGAFFITAHCSITITTKTFESYIMHHTVTFDR